MLLPADVTQTAIRTWEGIYEAQMDFSKETEVPPKAAQLLKSCVKVYDRLEVLLRSNRRGDASAACLLYLLIRGNALPLNQLEPSYQPHYIGIGDDCPLPALGKGRGWQCRPPTLL
jgi:hypothetical protein